jgi:hypothetical protein
MRLLFVLAVVLALAAPLDALEPADALADARRLYNLGNYEAAERAAQQAVEQPSSANAARVVLGRIQLERYRAAREESHLTDARTALRAVDPRLLDDRERLEWTIGLAEALYLEDKFGAAAELFAPLIDASAALGPVAHDRVLDWWATALDRRASQSPADRAAIYDRIVERMTLELSKDPGSLPAGYWIVAAARGRGDLERAWQAALAGWLRAPLGRDRGSALRGDLDRLVVQAIIPDRIARLGLRDSTQALAGMLGEWEAFKATWGRQDSW